jgi:deoxyribodipyrimidine photolyase-related protein
MEAVIVFPHQLFTSHPCFTKERLILLVEEPRFFSAFSFHKKKLIFHRASLKSFEADLKKKGIKLSMLKEI